MIMTLYHGSDSILEKPEYGKGAVNNDFGRGFYCTEDAELAKEWACKTQKDGYVNSYEINPDGLKILNLENPRYNILNWLAVLAENRTYWQNGSIARDAKAYLRENFLIDISGYDLIIGYRADDSYFAFAQDFVSGTISLQKLSQAMRLGNLGIQAVLKSRRAFERLRFTGYEAVDAEVYYARKMEREKQARREYRRNLKNGSTLDEIYILDIMREEMKNDDARLL